MGRIEKGFDFLSAPATSTANKNMTTARFIVSPSFPHARFLSLHDCPTYPSNIRRGKKKEERIKKKAEGMIDLALPCGSCYELVMAKLMLMRHFV